MKARLTSLHHFHVKDIPRPVAHTIPLPQVKTHHGESIEANEKWQRRKNQSGERHPWDQATQPREHLPTQPAFPGRLVGVLGNDATTASLRGYSLVTLLLTVGAITPIRAELVTIQYEAEAATVVGQPFGLNVPRLTRIQGIFRYESGAPDLKPNDLRRGSFILGPSSWHFEAHFLGQTLEGSIQAAASTETFGHTLRFNDGGDRDDTRDMRFNGISRPDLALGFSIVGNASNLPTDQLPAPFNYQIDAPHTFVIEDQSGRILLQFLSINQIPSPPSPPILHFITLSPQGAKVSWNSTPGQRYQLERSPDLLSWTPVGDPVNATTKETTTTAGLESGTSSFYRIRHLATP